jgi:hypothetical protein
MPITEHRRWSPTARATLGEAFQLRRTFPDLQLPDFKLASSFDQTSVDASQMRAYGNEVGDFTASASLPI